LHGDDIREFNNNQTFFYKRLIKPVITSVFNKSKRLITVSSWQVEDLEPRYKTKIIKIPNGVDTKAFKPSKTKNKHIVALYAGRLITTKGIREIVKVANVSPQVDFWFAGTGPLAASLIGSNIKYLGFKDTTELCDLYQQATFCIFPSYFEAFPLVGLEAMSCGKPIICTARGFDEYAKNGFNSIIIKPKDIKSLHKAVMRLSSDSSFCRELSANARLTSGNFDWSKIAKQHYDLYNEIVTESKEDTVTESYQNLNH
jgi:glycosyltransferase involved in cell wall biosynthesis